MKNALILCFTNLKNDARVRRQIDYLKDDYKTTVVCFDSYPDPKVEIIHIKPTKLTFLRKIILSAALLMRFHQTAFHLLHDYKNSVEALKHRAFDLIVANDIETLPYAFDLASAKTKVVFDAHEYSPRQFEDRLYWRVFFKRFITDLCKEYVPRTAGMTTINAGLAEAYKNGFKVNPVIITNASDYFDLEPVTTNRYPIRLVHHGIFTVSRSPEIMLEMMELLDNRFTLDLYYLISENASAKTKDYFNEFCDKAKKTGRVRVLPPIKSTEIVSTLHSKYDLGIILVPPVNFNYENGLPNKLFDCIQARLGMAVGPLKEIAKVVTTYNLGVVSKEFTARSMADVLSKVDLPAVNSFKLNTQKAATEMNAKINKKIFLDLVAGLL